MVQRVSNVWVRPNTRIPQIAPRIKLFVMVLLSLAAGVTAVMLVELDEMIPANVESDAVACPLMIQLRMVLLVAPLPVSPAIHIIAAFVVFKPLLENVMFRFVPPSMVTKSAPFNFTMACELPPSIRILEAPVFGRIVNFLVEVTVGLALMTKGNTSPAVAEL